MLRKLLVLSALGASLAGGALADVNGAPVLLVPPQPTSGSFLGSSPLTPNPARANVFAVVGARVLSGQARQLRLGPDGVIELKDTQQPQFTCEGKYAEIARAMGEARLACSDRLAPGRGLPQRPRRRRYRGRELRRPGRQPLLRL